MADDLFKGQQTMLRDVQNENKLVDSGLDEIGTSSNGARTHVGLRSTIIFIIVMFVAIFTVAGGYAIVAIEEHSDPDKVYPWDDCMKLTQKEANRQNFSINRTIQFARECVIDNAKISEPINGFFFVYTLYSTIGYGGLFPHTCWGQVFTLFYSFFICPVYTSLKVEFGEFIAILTLNFIQKIMNKFRSWKTKRKKVEELEKEENEEPTQPHDAVIVLILLGIFLAIVAFISGIVLVLNMNTVTYFEALYLTLITIYSIGLGDTMPAANWATFAIVIPMWLMGETIYCYLNYYILGVYRLIANRMALSILSPCSCCRKDHGIEQESRDVQEIVNFPTVSHNSMQLFEPTKKAVEELSQKGIDQGRRILRALPKRLSGERGSAEHTKTAKESRRDDEVEEKTYDPDTLKHKAVSTAEELDVPKPKKPPKHTSKHGMSSKEVQTETTASAMHGFKGSSSPTTGVEESVKTGKTCSQSHEKKTRKRKEANHKIPKEQFKFATPRNSLTNVNTVEVPGRSVIKVLPLDKTAEDEEPILAQAAMSKSNATLHSAAVNSTPTKPQKKIAR